MEDLAITMDFISRGAPSLPFYYYHIPSMTGVEFKMKDFLAAAVAGNYIPTLHGIKFTHYDLIDLLSCVKFDLRGKAPNMLYGRCLDTRCGGGWTG